MRPPCDWAMAAQMARPSPLPPLWRLRACRPGTGDQTRAPDRPARTPGALSSSRMWTQPPTRPTAELRPARRVGVAQAVVQQVAQQLGDARGVPAPPEPRPQEGPSQPASARPRPSGAHAADHAGAPAARRLLRQSGRTGPAGRPWPADASPPPAGPGASRLLSAVTACGRPAAARRLPSPPARRATRSAGCGVHGTGRPASGGASLSMRCRLSAMVLTLRTTSPISSLRVIRDAHRQLALGDAGGGVLHRHQRASPLARQPERHDQRQQQQRCGERGNAQVLRTQEPGLAGIRCGRQRTQARQCNHCAVDADRPFDDAGFVACNRRADPGAAIRSGQRHARTEPVLSAGPGEGRAPRALTGRRLRQAIGPVRQRRARPLRQRTCPG